MNASTVTLDPAQTPPLPRPRASVAVRREPPALTTPAAAAATPATFTIDGSAELERHLTLTCAKIAAGIRGLIPSGKLEAVLLGGGYGRGEGGVLSTPTGDRPYNDLEFYVCLRGNRHLNERRFGHALHVLGEILTPQAGVEVEFKITSLRDLERARIDMFTYDLVVGHRWLVGGPELLARCAHHRTAEKIPLSEATRLLMNRCSGLLFAREKFEKREFTAADADFVRRNIAKAQLALGDAVLVAHQRYHWSVRERHRRIEELAAAGGPPWLGRVSAFHAVGVEFKLYPVRSTASHATLLAEHAAVTEVAKSVWLWIESQRLGIALASPTQYATTTVDKCSGTRPLRNLLVQARALGPRSLVQGRTGRHPRERIFNAMTLLLWVPGALDAATLRQQLQTELRTGATTFPEMMRAYRGLWERVN